MSDSSEKLLEPGHILDGRYEIKRIIKSGGMGVVYEGADLRFDGKIYAVKEMTAGTDNEEEEKYFIKRFKEEAFILNSLKHPCLPSVKDYFTSDGRYYLVMDYIDGKDLEAVMKEYEKGQVPESLVIQWATEILDALSHLHSQSPPVIYRDLKPGNIMIQTSNKKAILIDFGIARRINPSGNTVKTVVGTPAYAPLELLMGKPEPRTDLYSLGATMHCLLTGEVPSGPYTFKPVRELNPHISEELEKIIIKSLSLEVSERYENAEEMKKALEGICKKEPAPVTISSNVHPPSYDNIPVSEVKTEEISPVASVPASKAISLSEVKTEKIIKNNERRKFILPAIILFLIISYLIYSKFIVKNRHNSLTDMPVSGVTPSGMVKRPSMVFIQGGTFTMGGELNNDEKPLHEVSVNSFYMSNYEVTCEEYCRFLNFMGNENEGGSSWMSLDTGGGIGRDSETGVFYVKEEFKMHPAVYVNWYGAVAYCNWLSKMEGRISCYGEKGNRGKGDRNKKGYRLPSEAEWEYASRAGSTVNYYWGAIMDDSYCWYQKNSDGNHHVVGQKKPNKWGLYDMSGNVWEWCDDWFGPYSEKKNINPAGPLTGKDKVYRGGGWYGGVDCCRSADRFFTTPGEKNNGLGFRIVRSGK
ncbi:MAG: bifunctional serine/threonine-protein kinase/formylglycine-generating enzyme family protein [Candidatus Eremiobacterota bacterium]